LAAINTLSDHELIALLKRGDNAAFTEIYDRYAMAVFYRVNQMLRDEETSKDLVQDLFITIWSKAELIREETNLAGYLYIAARNRVFKTIQKGKLRNDYLSSLARFASHANTSLTDDLDVKELAGILAKEISQLPPKMKEVFNLSRKENLSHAQIASQLGISDKTVKKQINNALKVLKHKLGTISPTGLLLLALLHK
jgi:RNA polymerase sigma-70 factor (family 1)